MFRRAINKISHNLRSLLLIESIINIAYAVLVNLILILILGSANYSIYALGITAAALASVTSVGIQVLVPQYYVQNINVKSKILLGIKLQAAILIFYIVFCVFFSIPALKFLFVKIELTKSMLLYSALYFFSQTVDETVHVMLRVSSRESISLKLSAISKSILLVIVTSFSEKYKNGSISFSAITITLFLISLAKGILYLSPSNENYRISRHEIKSFSSNYFGMWLGNVSNAIFNGAIRLIIGESYGAKTIGMLTISSQIGSAMVALANSLVLKKVISAKDASLTLPDLYKALKGANYISIMFSLFCFTLTLVILIYYFYIRSGDPITSLEIALIIVPFSLVYSANIIVTACYQVCQFFDLVRYVSYCNFLLAIIGLVLIYVANYIINQPKATTLIFVFISIASATCIIFIFKNFIKTSGVIKN